MSKNTDSSIKLLVLYDILLKSTNEEHVLSTNEIIEELKKRGISVSRKVLPSDIDLLRKLLLYDNFNCWDEGCLVGPVSKEVIAQMRKSN